MDKKVKAWSECFYDALAFILAVAGATVFFGCIIQYCIDKSKGLL